MFLQQQCYHLHKQVRIWQQKRGLDHLTRYQFRAGRWHLDDEIVLSIHDMVDDKASPE